MAMQIKRMSRITENKVYQESKEEIADNLIETKDKENNELVYVNKKNDHINDHKN